MGFKNTQWKDNAAYLRKLVDGKDPKIGDVSTLLNPSNTIIEIRLQIRGINLSYYLYSCVLINNNSFFNKTENYVNIEQY